ncbi:MAG TPA: GNAT family N-acetyltransferase [Chthonomonadales bacterium]|nr:GNAT family N-acetyltransferase [Chthonomonadales bacterium]
MADVTADVTAPLDASRLAFRRLCLGDLPLLHQWLSSGPPRQWFARRDMGYHEVVEHYRPYIAGGLPTHAFLALYDDHPVAYLQYYLIRDYPEYSRQIRVCPCSAGLDLFIGDQDYLHRGLGAPMLRRFMAEVVFVETEADCCHVGPDETNVAAIRCYERAGFAFVKRVQVAGELHAEHLMCMERSALLGADG